jgi:hypothetical protein
MTSPPEHEGTNAEAADLIKPQHTLKFAQDGLVCLVTLSGGLTGGAVLLLTDYTLGWPFRLSLLFLLAALVCALQGILVGLDSDSAAVGEPTQQVARRKIWWLHRAIAMLLCGLGLAAVGVLIR